MEGEGGAVATPLERRVAILQRLTTLSLTFVDEIVRDSTAPREPPLILWLAAHGCGWAARMLGRLFVSPGGGGTYERLETISADELA
jgi:hypothetical protein